MSKEQKKRLKKIPAKSSQSSSAAETFIITSSLSKPDLQFSSNCLSTKRNNSLIIQRPKRGNSEYKDILLEKDNQIKRLQNKNSYLKSQLDKLTKNIKETRKKEKTKFERTRKKTEIKVFKSNSRHANSDRAAQRKDRPGSAALETNRFSYNESGLRVLPSNMDELLVKTERILKEWKKRYKNKG